MAPKFEDNIILTKTERLMMSNRPKNPANARNKNVLIVGGSGAGKTRFWLTPQLLQAHSSFVVVDPILDPKISPQLFHSAQRTPAVGAAAQKLADFQ